MKIIRIFLKDWRYGVTMMLAALGATEVAQTIVQLLEKFLK
jgi:hypothetical protein